MLEKKKNKRLKLTHANLITELSLSRIVEKKIDWNVAAELVHEKSRHDTLSHLHSIGRTAGAGYDSFSCISREI